MNLRSDEAGCHHNNFLLAAVRDGGRQVGIEVARYDFSELQYRKDICDRILCPMKSSIQRYCNEGHDVISAKDVRVALSERWSDRITTYVFFTTTYLILANLQAAAGGKKCYFRR